MLLRLYIYRICFYESRFVFRWIHAEGGEDRAKNKTKPERDYQRLSEKPFHNYRPFPVQSYLPFSGVSNWFFNSLSSLFCGSLEKNDEGKGANKKAVVVNGLPSFWRNLPYSTSRPPPLGPPGATFASSSSRCSSYICGSPPLC